MSTLGTRRDERNECKRGRGGRGCDHASRQLENPPRIALYSGAAGTLALRPGSASTPTAWRWSRSCRVRRPWPARALRPPDPARRRHRPTEGARRHHPTRTRRRRRELAALRERAGKAPIGARRRGRRHAARAPRNARHRSGTGSPDASPRPWSMAATCARTPSAARWPMRALSVVKRSTSSMTKDSDWCAHTSPDDLPVEQGVERSPVVELGERGRVPAPDRAR